MVHAKILLLSVLLALMVAVTVPEARAQGSGATPGSEEETDFGPSSDIFDPREEMRVFIQNISTFVRSYRRDFVIIPQNGIELVFKRIDGDEERKAPARTYMSAIGGVIQEALFFGIPEFDVTTEEDRLNGLLELTDMAKANGLAVFVVDFGKSAETIDESRQLSAARDYISFTAPARGFDLNSLPTYPHRPFGENPASILSAREVRNFFMLLNTRSFGSQEEFAMAVQGTNYDMVVVDVFHRPREPLTKRSIDTLKYKKLGARRMVLAYINIGAAASYRYYWQPEWREGSPMWISGSVPGNPDQHYVQYWHPEWQQIIFGNIQSYIYGIIDQGFDGVVLDGIEAFRYFEGQGENVVATP